MGAVTFVSASAGSGKTWRVVETVVAAVRDGTVRPEAVIATTFTIRAADELRRRLRERLVAEGMNDAAERMLDARIGTVHSLALGMVRDHALDLGLAPGLRVLDDDEARELFAETYERCLDDEAREAFVGLCERMTGFDPEAAVRETVEAARMNRVTPSAFGAWAERSVASLLALLPPSDAGDLTVALAAAVTRALAALPADPAVDGVRATLAGAAAMLVKGVTPPWSTWWRLLQLDAGVRFEGALAPVRAVASKHLAHPSLQRDLARAVSLVFDLAGRTAGPWDDARRRASALDFTDQETLFLDLLGRDDIVAALASEVDLVVVDEFQDTSPLQLAVFARLASLAPRSLWVGDPKQSIYGFRGADPALVSAAVNAALGGRDPEVLSRSYRSRAPLVALTSELFARAFEREGVPRERVTLEAAAPDDVALGPTVERWRLGGRSAREQALSTARCVMRFLDDPAVRVRSREGAPRPPKPSDVAVLCRTHASCEAVASALSVAGVPCSVARPGLCGRLEAVVSIAALKLLHDPGDRLAKATLARLTDEDPECDAWLRALLSRDDGALDDVLAVRAVRSLGAETRGLVASLDAVTAALDLPRLAARWGDLPQRLANLDALRSLTTRYADRCARSFEPATAPTLAAWLDGLAARGDDAQGRVGGAAVEVLTWHASKGLEWPVAVLADLDVLHEGSALGVRAVSDGAFSLDDPLAGRWLRYWPSPYEPGQRGGVFEPALARSDAARDAERAEREQALRLLYVAWTRARDRVVLAAPADRLGRGILSLLEYRGVPMVIEPMGARARWAGQAVDVVTREAPPRVIPWAGAARPEVPPLRAPRVERAPAIRRPSDDVREGAVRQVFRLGAPLSLDARVEPRALGLALHAVFAGDDPSAPVDERETVVAELLAAHGVERALAAADAVRAHDRLLAWASRWHPGAERLVEWPVWRRCDDGALLRGRADLVLRGSDGVVVVDHKAHLGDEETVLVDVAAHFGQLAAYAGALGAGASAKLYVHLPLQGIVVSVGPAGSPRLADEFLESSGVLEPSMQPTTTDYHARYWASALRLERPRHEVAGLARSIGNARVDLNPHQIDAALFALRSPWSKGVLLADEVGLGKTIEAGLVLAQKWAERRRRILLVAPATLRKQWQSELEQKFFLPSVILETKTFKDLKKAGAAQPFRRTEAEPAVVIASYEFVYARRDDAAQVEWDLVIIDEAHRLRSIYKKTKKAKGIVDALRNAPKVLLTATPLQNTLMELYGLVSILDPDLFGGEEAFHDQYIANDDPDERNALLKDRVKHVCTRTLRRQVIEYVRFTQRFTHTVSFAPSAQEQELYDKVSDYLQREVLVALPNRQRKLITLILRRLLASSSAAIGATLQKFVERLKKAKAEGEAEGAIEVLAGDFETAPEIEEEWGDDEDEVRASAAPATAVDREMDELAGFVRMASSVGEDAKARALVGALETAFKLGGEKGAARKAVIFTESVKTQEYLVWLLSENGYEGQIAVMNGTNADEVSKGIYNGWKKRHAANWKDVTSGSKTADMKASIVEEFRDRRTLLVATESAAEGVNLQFCSIVINYDLPWNPQRIEQRIGRCHRYGQRSDVLVVNFLNQKNEADQRVFEILSEKFRLFDGVFGTSDEVLGTVEGGVDVERAIADIYQRCRTSDEIQTAFTELQRTLDEKIQARMADTRRVVLDNFDEDVHRRLKLHRDQAQAALDEQQRTLLALCRHELRGVGRFEDGVPAFELPEGHPYAGRYHLSWPEADASGRTFLRADHPVAAALADAALARELPPARVTFRAHSRASALSDYVGRSGWLEVARLSATSVQRTEEWLLVSACTDDGKALPDDVAEKFFLLDAMTEGTVNGGAPEGLAKQREAARKRRLGEMERRTETLFDEETEKLDNREEDLRHGIEQEIKRIDKEIAAIQKEARKNKNIAEKVELQKKAAALQEKLHGRRKRRDEEQDRIREEKQRLIASLEESFRERQAECILLCRLHWTLV